MNQILELREKRAKAWEAAKAFLDSKRNQDGFVSAEDTQTYEKMEEDVIALGKEIERLERQAAIDLELAKPTSFGCVPSGFLGQYSQAQLLRCEEHALHWCGYRGRLSGTG